MAKEINVTSEFICEFWDITKQTLSNWVKDGYPKEADDKYPLLAGKKWYDENKSGEMAELKKRKLLAEIKNKERENLVADGDLISNSEHEGQLKELIHIFNSALDSLPRRLPGVLEGLPARDMEPEIKKETRELRTKLSQLADRKKVKK